MNSGFINIPFIISTRCMIYIYEKLTSFALKQFTFLRESNKLYFVHLILFPPKYSVCRLSPGPEIALLLRVVVPGTTNNPQIMPGHLLDNNPCVVLWTEPKFRVYILMFVFSKKFYI